MKKPRCYNCKYSGKQFKIDKLTHLHCEHSMYIWDTLRVFSDTCVEHEFKEVRNDKI